MSNSWFRDRIALRMSRGRSAVLWGLAFFLGLHLCMAYPLVDLWPHLHDPEYGGKLSRLREALAHKSPRQPLVVVLGSSHIGMGIRPSVLPSDPDQPLLFNFGIHDGTILVELLCLHRLLAEGIRPDCVLLEVCPVLVQLDGLRAQSNCAFMPERLHHSDLGVLARYYKQPHQMRVQWRRMQTAPWFYQRFFLMSEWTPSWLPRWQRLDPRWRNMDALGWQWIDGLTHSGAEYPAIKTEVCATYSKHLKPFQVSDETRRAFDELLRICQQEHIQVALLRMPEARFLREWYPPAVSEPFDLLLAQLTQEYQVPMINGRDWVADSGFPDGHHLNPQGAEAFMRRLGPVITRFLAGAQPR